MISFAAVVDLSLWIMFFGNHQIFWNGMLEHGDINRSASGVSQNIVETEIRNHWLMAVISTINIGLVPSVYRGVVATGTCVYWNVYLAHNKRAEIAEIDLNNEVILE